MLVEITNETYVKYSMVTQSYNVVSTHANEISGYKFLSRILYSRAPNIGGMNGDVQSDLFTMAERNLEIYIS